MVLIGYLSDFFLSVLKLWRPLIPSFFEQMIFVGIALVITAFAASLYMSAKMGVAPYDAIAMEAERRWKIKFRVGRVVTDAACVTIGFLLGGTVGVGTVCTVLLMGPMVAFFRTAFVDGWLNKK